MSKLEKITKKLILDNMLSAVYQMHGIEAVSVVHGGNEVLQIDCENKDVEKVAESLIEMAEVFLCMSIEIMGSTFPEDERDKMRKAAYMMMSSRLVETALMDNNKQEHMKAFVTKYVSSKDKDETH